ncbi:MAG: sugar phosphate isomerase/epimerase family protein [Chitinophagaceae bacterium]
MPYNRRKFLQTTGLFAAGSVFAKNAFAANGKSKLLNVGLQLWTVKEDMAKDPKNVLKQVASFGYTQIESFEGDQGMFWGMKPMEFKKYVDGLGMTAVSSHCNDIYKDSFKAKAEDAAKAGLKFLISPSESNAKSVDDFKKLADRFNACGEICKSNGLRFGYHNHDAIFKPVSDQIPMDILLANTDKNLVVYEMDIYWVITAGADPKKYLKQYNDRFKLCHIKDRMKNADPKEEDASCIVGEGSIDFAAILRTAKDNGVRYYIVEQERFDNSTPLQSAEADVKYLKNLNI